LPRLRADASLRGKFTEQATTKKNRCKAKLLWFAVSKRVLSSFFGGERVFGPKGNIFVTETSKDQQKLCSLPA
jgi:hypothetical protein